MSVICFVWLNLGLLIGFISVFLNSMAFCPLGHAFWWPVGKSPIKKNHLVKRVRLRLFFKQVLAFVMTSGSVTDGDNADTEMTRMGSASQGEDSPRRFTKPTR